MSLAVLSTSFRVSFICGDTELQAGCLHPDHALPTGGGRCGWDCCGGGGPLCMEEGLGVTPSSWSTGGCSAWCRRRWGKG